MALLNMIREFRRDSKVEFYGHVAPILSHTKVQVLDNYTQHRNYTRLRHCIDVAYCSFIIAKLLNWDSRSAARAGLLHDMYFNTDYDTDKWQHLTDHPYEALENAKTICALNEIEEDAILKHMWLCTLSPPRYKEGFVVTFVDKFCALRELSANVFSRGINTQVSQRVLIPLMNRIPAIQDGSQG